MKQPTNQPTAFGKRAGDEKWGRDRGRGGGGEAKRTDGIKLFTYVMAFSPNFVTFCLWGRNKDCTHAGMAMLWAFHDTNVAKCVREKFCCSACFYFSPQNAPPSSIVKQAHRQKNNECSEASHPLSIRTSQFVWLSHYAIIGDVQACMEAGMEWEGGGGGGCSALAHT